MIMNKSSFLKLMILVLIFNIGYSSIAQISKKEVIIKNNNPTMTPFKFNGSWQITNMDMNIVLKGKHNPIPINVFQKNEYLGKVFHFDQSNKIVKYRERKKVFLSSTIESYNLKQSTFIVRRMTGGYSNWIANSAPNEAVLSMHRPAFFLFITNLKIKRENYKNFSEYEEATSQFYKDLLENYISVGDSNIKFYLKKID